MASNLDNNDDDYEYSDEEDYDNDASMRDMMEENGEEEDGGGGDDDDDYDDDDDDWNVDDDDNNNDWNEENPNAAPMQSFKSVPIGNLKSGIRILRAEDLRPVMERRIGDVVDILGVSAAAAAVLLRNYKFSKEQLLEEYMLSADRIMKQAGVWNRCGGGNGNANAIPTKTTTAAAAAAIPKTCPICYDDSDNMMSMPCGHEFCMDCWHDFCDNAVQEGPACVTVTCPHASCPEVVTEEEMKRALASSATTKTADASQLQKYHSYQLRSFVESNGLTRWCPGVGCDRIACAESASALEAMGNVASCTSCYTNFCLVCGEEPHAPASCKDMDQWNEKCRNESETANWILANTKSCPQCRGRIEKNQGCNHMTCSNCKHEFCWICMGDWKDHGASTGGYYKCNKFDSNGGTVDDGDQSDAAKAKRDLDRYLHYYKRFHAHQEAQQFAKKQLKETEARMIALQESSDGAKWTDVEFLKTANEQLVECRRVLKYTYAFAFYMDQSPAASMQRERFEHHQEMLERFTEHLSELSEKPLPEMDRTGVVNQTRVVDRFMKNILEYVDAGMMDYD